MKTPTSPRLFREGSIYTLGETGTGQIRKSAVLTGQGTALEGADTMNNRAKRKAITNALTLALVDIAKERDAHDREQEYWNMYHCAQKIKTHKGRAYMYYCKNRFCTICAANRKATLINNYYAEIRSWEQPFFVTLTVKSVLAPEIRRTMKAMLRFFKRLLNRYKKRHQRGTWPKIKLVRSLECNFNATKRTYNPHFHIIVNGQQSAMMLRWEWLNYLEPKFAGFKGQSVIKITDLDHHLIETIKYGTKVFSEPDPNKKNKKGKKKKTDLKVYALAMDNIYTAMKGLRQFERFGFNLPPLPDKEAHTCVVTNFREWEFSPEACDWINKSTGERLTGYIMPHDLEHLLTHCIDMELS